MTNIKRFFLALTILALQACGGGDDCEAGTGTFKPLPKECADEKAVK